MSVFQTILNLIKYTLYFSFFEENSKHIVTCVLSSNNHSGIRGSSFFLLKFLIVFSITCFGHPASVYLLLFLVLSSSKSEAILLALCSSPVIAFLSFVLKGNFWRPVHWKLFCFVINLRLNSLVGTNNFSIKKLIWIGF